MPSSSVVETTAPLQLGQAKAVSGTSRVPAVAIRSSRIVLFRFVIFIPPV